MQSGYRAKLRLAVSALAAGAAVAFGVWSANVMAQGLPPTIRIGVSVGLSGPGAVAGLTAKTMLDMLVKEFNAAGGIAGRPVEIFFADDEIDPTKAVIAVKRLVDDEKVNVVLGPAAAAPSMAVAPDLTRAKILSFPMTGANTITAQTYPYGFGTFYSSDAFSDAMVDYAVDMLKAKTIGAMVDTGAQGKAAAEEFKTYAAKRGVKLVAVEFFDFAADDVSPQVLNLRRANPEVVLHVSTQGDSVGKLYATANQLNWSPKIISQVAATFVAQIKKIAGDGVYASGRVFGPTFKSTTFCKGDNTDLFFYNQFRNRLKAFSPDASKLLVSLAPVFVDGLYLAKAAIEGTKSVDGPTLAAWVEQNSSKVSGTGGTFGATRSYHLIFGPDAIAFVSRPDLPDANGFMPRAGC